MLNSIPTLRTQFLGPSLILTTNALQELGFQIIQEQLMVPANFVHIVACTINDTLSLPQEVYGKIPLQRSTKVLIMAFPNIILKSVIS